MFFQEQAIIGNLNIAPAVNWAGKNSKDYTRLFLEVRSNDVYFASHVFADVWTGEK